MGEVMLCGHTLWAWALSGMEKPTNFRVVEGRDGGSKAVAARLRELADDMDKRKRKKGG